jgi:hypothetical protein
MVRIMPYFFILGMVAKIKKPISSIKIIGGI